MLEIYSLKITENNGTTFRVLSVPARNLTEAYIYTQIKIPDAIIVDIECSGKVITITEKEQT